MKTAPTTMNPPSNYQRLLQACLDLFPDYRVTTGSERGDDYIEITYPFSGMNFHKRYYLEVSVLIAADDTQLAYLGWVHDRLCEFTNDLGTDVTGLYPFARLWYDRHGKTISKIFGRPQADVPNWVWQNVKKSGEYPDDLGKSVAHSDIRGSINMESSDDGFVVPPENNVKPPTATAQQHMTFVERDNQEALEKQMATVKKRKVVRKAPVAVDPNKVRPPSCNLHGTPMKYNPVTMVWDCQSVGCNQVARPKRDKDSRDLILGKGDVELRLVQQDDKTTVILISSDNVALDITKFVDIQRLIEEADAVTLAQTAEDAAKEQFLINSDQTIQLTSQVVLIGVTDFLNAYRGK